MTRQAHVLASFLLPTAALSASLLAGWAVAHQGSGVSRPLLALLAGGAYVVVMLSLPPMAIFAMWLFSAPFLQELARASELGDGLRTALYMLLPLLLVLALLLRPDLRGFRWYDAVPALYVILVVSSLAVTGLLRDAPQEWLRAVYLNPGVGVVAYYFLAFRDGAPRHVLVVKTFLLSSSAIAVTALVEYATGWTLWGSRYWTDRVAATLTNPAVLGTFLGSALVLALAVLIWNGPRELRRLSAVTILLAIPAIFVTHTRGPMLAVAAVAVSIILLRRPYRIRGALGFAVVAAAVVVAWGAIAGSTTYEQRLSVTETIAIRQAIQQVSLDLAAERPVLGWGYGMFDQAKNESRPVAADISFAAVAGNTSHNTFLTKLVELGALGLFVFFLPWIAVSGSSIAQLIRGDDEPWLLAGVLAVVAVYLISSSTYDTRFFSLVAAIPWIALGLARRRVRDTAQRA